MARGYQLLGPGLEVPGVWVIPAPAPDEALRLEGVDDGLRDPVAPARLRPRSWPAPVVGARHADVDGDSVGVRADPVGAGDVSLRETAAQLLQKRQKVAVALHGFAQAPVHLPLDGCHLSADLQ